MKHYYPAVFIPKGCELKGYTLRFPDIKAFFTMGDDLDECMSMAHDALGCMLEGVDEKDYPAPSKVADVDLSDFPEGSFVNIVEFDTERYFHTIRYEARKAGLNIKQTADLLGAPYRTVQNWFNGTRQPAPWLERLIVKEIQAAAE